MMNFPSLVDATQLLKKQFQIQDKTELPPEYVELRSRVASYKAVRDKMLQVAQHYENEPYDYPLNLAESFNDLGRTMTERIHLLSEAKSPAEAQSALLSSHSSKLQPKTFSHALARAALASSHMLVSNDSGAAESSLLLALEKYAIASEKIGRARLEQDELIKSSFLDGWGRRFNAGMSEISFVENQVKQARREVDAAKSNVNGTGPFGFRGQNDDDLDDLDDKQRTQIHRAEEVLNRRTEEAISTMKNVIENPQTIKDLADLVTAQMEYHKQSYEILRNILPDISDLYGEQIEIHRKNCQGA